MVMEGPLCEAIVSRCSSIAEWYLYLCYKVYFSDELFS
jgi:hypothetical protein